MPAKLLGLTPPQPPSSEEEVRQLAEQLLQRVEDRGQRFRLVGVGLANFTPDAGALQAGLF